METPVHRGLGADVRKSPSTGTRLRLWLMDQGTAMLVIVLLLLAWEASVRLLKIPQFILPGPSVIIRRMLVDWHLILQHSTVTVEETLLGFALSTVVGIPLAIGIVYSPSSRRSRTRSSCPCRPSRRSPWPRSWSSGSDTG